MNRSTTFTTFCFCLLFVCVLLSGCKKKEQTTYYYLPQYFKDYMVYKQGSYWIYRNEVTMDFDSCYISKVTQGFYSNDRNSLFEKILIEYKSDFYKTCFVDNGEVSLDSHDLSGTCMSTNDSPGMIFYYEDNVFYQFINHVDTIKIGNNNYTNVINSKYSEYENGPPSMTKRVATYFIAKGVGLISYRQQIGISDTTWNLIRYHIEK